MDGLIGPDTVNTMPPETAEAFNDHGTVARTVDAGVGTAKEVLAGLADVGVELDDVTEQLEAEGVAAFAKSFDDLQARLTEKAAAIRARADRERSAVTTGELSPKELGLSPSDMDVAEPAGEGTRRPDPLAMVIFGASGDLTHRKILPALSRLAERGALPEEFSVVGVARSPLSDQEFRQRALDADPTGRSSEWKRRVAHFSYIAGDDADPATFTRLAEKLCDVDASVGTAGNRLYYLATVPEQFAVVVRGLGRVGLNTAGKPGGFARLVIEKPFGADVDSARQLSADIHAHFDEAQIFRIDHYMGKETVQNILALRFANSVFEPIWNRRHVDHVQVTVAESLGVEGRGEFYEHAGALRDIVQNHLMQVLALTLMEPPGSEEGDVIRDEKVKLLGSVVVFDEKEAAAAVVRGQYGAGTIGGEPVPAYRAEPGVDAHSEVETYVAIRVDVDNWRWAGVPIFVRTGKRLPQRVTEVVMVFQRPPHLPFTGKLARDLRRDSLTLKDPARRGDQPHVRREGPGTDVQGEQRLDGLLLQPELPGPDGRRLRPLVARRDGRRPDVVHPGRRGPPRLDDRAADPGVLRRLASTARPLRCRQLGTRGGGPSDRDRQSALAELRVTRGGPMVGDLRVVRDVGMAFAELAADELREVESGQTFHLGCSGGTSGRECFRCLAAERGHSVGGGRVLLRRRAVRRAGFAGHEQRPRSARRWARPTTSSPGSTRCRAPRAPGPTPLSCPPGVSTSSSWASARTGTPRRCSRAPTAGAFRPGRSSSPTRTPRDATAIRGCRSPSRRSPFPASSSSR